MIKNIAYISIFLLFGLLGFMWITFSQHSKTSNVEEREVEIKTEQQVIQDIFGKELGVNQNPEV